MFSKQLDNMFLYQTPGETAGPPPEDDFQMAAPDPTGELSGSESVAEEPEEEHHEEPEDDMEPGDMPPLQDDGNDDWDKDDDDSS